MIAQNASKNVKVKVDKKLCTLALSHIEMPSYSLSFGGRKGRAFSYNNLKQVFYIRDRRTELYRHKTGGTIATHKCVYKAETIVVVISLGIVMALQTHCIELMKGS